MDGLMLTIGRFGVALVCRGHTGWSLPAECESSQCSNGDSAVNHAAAVTLASGKARPGTSTGLQAYCH